MIDRLSNALVCLSVCLFVHLPRCGAQQVFSNDDGIREANFAARVVLMDEFIRRFNNDSSSEIRRYYLSHRRPFDKTREQLIRSLFNYGMAWDSVELERFVRRATNPENPEKLGFLADRWYAEARCGFLYHNAPVEVRLILRVQLNPDHTAEWVIAAVKPALELKEAAAEVRPPVLTGKRRLFIQPAANDTYFAELERDFADKRGLPGLFDSQFFERRSSGAFYSALMSDQLKFVAVREIKYHYLQVHDWIFTVENFDRPTRNSGWLITSIRPASTEQRLDYEKKLLEE